METMDTFSKDVIHEIKKRGVTPRPMWYFLVRRSVFWGFAIFSVLIGAISLSVAHFVFFDNGGINPSVLIESPLEAIFQGAPTLWIILFSLFVASAYVSLTKTRTGYRYQTLTAVLSVLAVTILLASVLILFDFGSGVYYYLTHNTGFIQSLIHSSDDIQIPF